MLIFFFKQIPSLSSGLSIILTLVKLATAQTPIKRFATAET
jgi:hypothetical protein